MATLEQCREALGRIADRLRSSSSSGGKTQDFDRTLSCEVPDLGVTFSGRLHDGHLTGLSTEPAEKAQIRLTTSSDDLVALTDGSLGFGTAYSSGRLKVKASIGDLLKIRGML